MSDAILIFSLFFAAFAIAAVVSVAADAWKGNRADRAVVGLVSCERTACSWHGRGVVGCRPSPRRPPPRRRRRRRCLSSYDYCPSHVYDKSCSQAVRRLSHSLLQPGLTRCAARMHHRTIRDLTEGEGPRYPRILELTDVASPVHRYREINRILDFLIVDLINV